MGRPLRSAAIASTEEFAFRAVVADTVQALMILVYVQITGQEPGAKVSTLFCVQSVYMSVCLCRYDPQGPVGSSPH